MSEIGDQKSNLESKLESKLATDSGKKRDLPNVLNYISNQPWLATESAVNTVLTIAQRMTDPEAVAAKLGRPLDNTQFVQIRDGVATLAITGTIFRYASWFHAISGGTSIQILSKDLNEALNNEEVKAIVLDIDSPGGEVNGISEFADMVVKARKIKPIIAYVGGSAASGAYWIASAASEIIVSETAILGSIGTVVQIVDTSKRDEKAGVRVYDIVSRKSPLKRVDLDSDQGKEQVLKMLDSITEVFISTVAKNRGVSVQKVESDFGRGGVLVGEENVNNGLADRLGSYEDISADLSKKYSSGEFTMSDIKKPEVNEEEIEITAETISALHPKIAEALRAEGADLERARIQGVQEKLMVGHEKLVETLKFDGKTTPDQAASAIVEAEKAKAEAVVEDLEADADDIENIESETSHPDAENVEDDSIVKNMVGGANSVKK